jgi:hypothetical protein
MYDQVKLIAQALLVGAIIVGCTTAPKTPRQYFAATYTAIGGASNAIASLAEGKVIQPEAALGLIDRLDGAKRITDDGKAIMQCRDQIKSAIEADSKCGTQELAESKARLATTIVLEIQQIIDRTKK